MSIVGMNGGPIALGAVPIVGQPPTVNVEAGFGDDGPMIRLTDPRTGHKIDMPLVLALRVNGFINAAAADLIDATRRSMAASEIVTGPGVSP